MKSIHKQDLLGLALIALLAFGVGLLTSGRLGFMVWAGASATVTIMEWRSRRQQRKLLQRMESVTADVLEHQHKLRALEALDPALAASIAANVQAAERLQVSLGEARQRLS